MVVVALQPNMPFMDRAGMATGTRKVADKLWNRRLPARPARELVKELYAAENQGKAEPSGSQDMIGLVYPGISRLDYDATFEGGVFPKQIESNNDPEIARWLESVIHVIPVAPRPDGYNPLGEKNLDPKCIQRLGQTGKDCYDAILRKDIRALGASMNDCTACWAALLPHTLRHHSLTINLVELLRHYQEIYPGAMYSGCGGGYLYVVSDQPVPGGFKIQVETGGAAKMNVVAVTGSFDDLRSRQVRLLEEAAKLGQVHVLLWADELVQTLQDKATKFPTSERQYFAQAMRYVWRVSVVHDLVQVDALPQADGPKPDIWVVDQSVGSAMKKRFCDENGLMYKVIPDDHLNRFPPAPPASDASAPGRKKVLVTGCFDWLHTGHVRFFEEVSEYGDVYAVAGHDGNIERLKGAGHPHFRQEERRYMIGAIRYVKSALISTGHGWLDAEPEIRLIKPDIYAVNEDGDKPEKKAFCQKNGIEYLVLKRLPKPGLTPRQSTSLRGF